MLPLSHDNRATLAEKAVVARKTIVLIEADESEKMDPRHIKVPAALQRVLEDQYGVGFCSRARIQARAYDFGSKQPRYGIVRCLGALPDPAPRCNVV